MSYFRDKLPIERLLVDQIQSYIRIIMSESHMATLYEIVNKVNSCMKAAPVDNMQLSKIIEDMEDLHHERVSGLYYLVPNERAHIESFQTRIEGNFESACREKIKQTITDSRRLISEASKRGEHIVTLRELTETEYQIPTIAQSVYTVLKSLYGANVNVFMRRETDSNITVSDSYSPFKETNSEHYKQRYYLCALLHSNEEVTRHRLSAEQLQHKKQVTFEEQQEPEPAAAAKEETTD